MRWNEVFFENEQLVELFDKKAPWSWDYQNDDREEASFKIENVPFKVVFHTRDQENWIVEFEDASASAWKADERWGNTGTVGDKSIQVFGTVMDIIKNFLENERPEGLIFSGDIRYGRPELYQSILKHQRSKLEILGYTMTSSEMNIRGDVEFILHLN